MFFHKHFIRGHGLHDRDTEAHERELPGHKPPELDEVERDVERNLRHILSTRRGYGYFVTTYGLSDINYTGQMVAQLKDEIWETIQLNEPRVELLKIDEHHDDDGAHLVLKLRVLEGKNQRKFVLDMGTRTFLPGRTERVPFLEPILSAARKGDGGHVEPGPFPEPAGPRARKGDR
jgi:phage baseplate assembly protein W